MLISDFCSGIARIIKKSRLILLLYLSLQLITFFLILWTIYNYQQLNSVVSDYENDFMWNRDNTINIEIRVPGLLDNEAYDKTVRKFLCDISSNDKTGNIGMYAYSNDYCKDYPYSECYSESEMDNMVDFLYLSQNAINLNQLNIDVIDYNLVNDASSSIPVIAGADYTEAEIGDKLSGQNYNYIVVGKLKKNCEWFSDSPVSPIFGRTSLDRRFVALMGEVLPLDCIANSFSNIYIESDDTKTTIDYIKNKLSDYGIIAIVKTSKSIIDEYKSDNNEEYSYLRQMAVLCLFVSLVAGVAIHTLLVDYHKYTLAVSYICGMKKKYIFMMYESVMIIINIVSFFVDWILLKMNFIGVDMIRPDIFITDTTSLSSGVCFILMLIYTGCILIKTNGLKYIDVMRAR